MVSRRKFAGLALASSAAVVFGSVSGQAIAGNEGKVKCWGVNACKGKSDCKAPGADCQGKNDCKGKGFVEMSRHACEAVGGSVRKES
jgi:uncharacterized membrane protein